MVLNFACDSGKQFWDTVCCSHLPHMTHIRFMVMPSFTYDRARHRPSRSLFSISYMIKRMCPTDLWTKCLLI